MPQNTIEQWEHTQAELAALRGGRPDWLSCRREDVRGAGRVCLRRHRDLQPFE